MQAPDGSAWGAGAPVAIRPGTSLAVKSSAELVSDATVVAGGAVKVKLQARDAYDNKASYDDTYPTDGWQLTATLLEGGPSVAVEAELDIVYGEGGKAEGHYDGTLKLTKAGTYEVSAKLKQQDGAVGVVKFDGSTNALTGTVQVTVLPGNLEAASAAASSDIVRGGGVGEVLDFTVTPMDAYGNPVAVTADVSCEVTLNRTVGPAEIGPVAAELLVDGAEGEVAGTTCSRNAACGAAATAADCQFEVRYRVRVAGTYSVDVKLAGEGIKDNPRSGVTFRAGEVDAAACTMLDQGTLADGTGARAGVPNEFTVQARDRFGNAVVDADSLVFQVYALLLGGRMPPPGDAGTSEHTADGVYRLTVTPELGGDYQISVQLGAVEIGAGDFPITLPFQPPPLDASKSYASGLGLSTTTAGRNASFSIQLVNVLGNYEDLAPRDKIYVRIDAPGALASSTAYRRVLTPFATDPDDDVPAKYAIRDGNLAIEKFSAAAEKADADVARLTDEIAELNKNIAAWSTDKSAATDMRKIGRASCRERV